MHVLRADLFSPPSLSRPGVEGRPSPGGDGCSLPASPAQSRQGVVYRYLCSWAGGGEGPI